MFLCSFSMSAARSLRAVSAWMVFQYLSKTLRRSMVAVRPCAKAGQLENKSRAEITGPARMPALPVRNQFFIDRKETERMASDKRGVARRCD